MDAIVNKGRSQLEDQLVSQGVKYLLASYVDMHGVSKGKAVPVSHLERMLGGSELCTGAALEGVPQDVSDEEVAAHPDAASCTVLPWKNDVAWFASDLWCRGQPFEACSRNILKRVLAKADAMGYGMNLGMEAEFFVLKDDPVLGFKPLSERKHLEKPAYDVTRTLDNMGWIGELVDAMNGLGWDVYSFDHEDGIGQFEIDFRYFDALSMADKFVFFRLMAHEIARKHGGFATFMPKPYADRAGSGAHFNMSLSDKKTGKNLFADPADPRGCGLSKLGYQFLAGVMKHLPAICAVVAPTVNSYKRLVLKGSMSGFTWAPVWACYGNNNRTNTLRIPQGGGRVELRAADSACNPYLGAALVLAAGLEGITNELDPGDPHTENMYLKSEAELKEMGVYHLPRTLDEAVSAFDADPLSEDVFGAAMKKTWVDYKRDEWLSYLNHVSDWERARYLKFY
ncbi:type III glutamate--ammonia ligase [Hyphomicrobium sp.]|uniref:type III glutamate--ammonia ligase n=1 Tax=Hyphomicrobium sp. TaxID=82 RepID=UPI002D7655CA|nr:type III glutamate--ammonia ligase [Hyphomicrobium sp.]HET6387979.1 type III glutamate--ammonia ligase [Hyphomicrobium sp.]